MTDSLLDAANPGGNEEALIASSKYLEKFDQLKRNQLGNENYNEDNEMDIIFIFSIVLVKREKQAVITKTTPKKVVVRGKKFSRKSRK